MKALILLLNNYVNSLTASNSRRLNCQDVKYYRKNRLTASSRGAILQVTIPTGLYLRYAHLWAFCFLGGVLYRER